MARPAKATATLVGHIPKDEAEARQSIETSLRGNNDKIIPPEWLNDGQLAVFECVVKELEVSGILGNVDVFLLTEFAVATERIFDIDKFITEQDVYDKDLIFARNSYVKDFWRGCNELSLSPQSRAKISMMNLSKKEQDAAPLRKLLAGKG